MISMKLNSLVDPRKRELVREAIRRKDVSLLLKKGKQAPMVEEKPKPEPEKPKPQPQPKQAPPVQQPAPKPMPQQPQPQAIRLPNSKLDIDLLAAVYNGNLKAVIDTLNQGADVDAKSSKGHTPLMIACVKGHAQIVKHLIQMNANAKLKDPSTGASALMYASSAGNAQIVADLLAKTYGTTGSDINDIDNDQRTSLHHAASAGNKDIIELLAQKGAKLDAIDKSRNTPIILAAMKNHHQAVRKLVEKGANINLQGDSGVTPLMIASKYDYIETAEVLVKTGVTDFHIVESTGHTALKVALLYGSERVGEFLLNNGGATGLSLKQAQMYLANAPRSQMKKLLKRHGIKK